MKAFEIIEKIEDTLYNVQCRIERKLGKECIVLYPSLTDTQMDCAFAGIASMVGDVTHLKDKTVIEVL